RTRRRVASRSSVRRLPSSSPLSSRLEDHRRAQPAGRARRAQRELTAAPLELPQRLRDLPRARRRERMPDRDRAAVHVELVEVDLADRLAAPELLLRELLARERLRIAEHLRRESLVHVDEVE